MRVRKHARAHTEARGPAYDVTKSAHARTYANIILRVCDAHNVAVMTLRTRYSGGDRAAPVAFRDVKVGRKL